MEDKHFDIRSEEVQDILSYVPNWMLRWGITLVAMIFVIVGLFSWFIKYPDTIEGKITLTTTHPPVKLINRIDGKLIGLKIEDGAYVKQGTVIAEIENSTNIEEITYLTEIASEISQHLKRGRIYHLPPSSFTFGDIQPVYNLLVKHLEDYKAHMENTYVAIRRKNLSIKLEQHKELIEINSRQIELLEKELENVKETYSAHQALYKAEVISKLDFLKKENEYHQMQKQLTNSQGTLIQSKITVSDLEDTQAQEASEFEERKRVLVANIEESVESIRNYIELWYQNNTLVAPIEGRLAYLKPLSTNQFVTATEALFSIVPEGNEYIGHVEIGRVGRGKVEVDQKVIVGFDNYPYREYGQLVAKVDAVSEIPTEDSYLIRVVFPKGLRTSYHRDLEYQPEMSGLAEIVTHDLRLAERFFYAIKGRIE